MALRALQASVATLQGIRRRRMFLNREIRGLPALHRVARRALSLIGALGKLALVRIRLVTVHALREYERFFEVAVRMTLSAVHSDVLPLERKLRFGVIKALIHRLQRNLLPAAGVVA